VSIDEEAADEWVGEKEKENDGPAPEIRVLQKEIRALKRKLQEGQGKEALIREAVAHFYERPPELIIPPPPKLTGKGDVQVAILHVSDTQLGKVTMDYDAAVCAQRIHKLAQKVVEIVEIKRGGGAKIDDLRLYLGGDMVEGEYGNYPSQPYDVGSSVIRQAMREAPDIFEGLIYYLLKYFKKLHILGVPGNHGRGASFKQTRNIETNWDRVFYWVLRDRLLGSDIRAKRPCLCNSKKMYKNCCGKEMRKRVTFDVPAGDQFWAMDRIWGWGNLVVHGDQIRGWAGIPWYGTQKKMHGWSDSMPRIWDNLLFGHFHTYASGTINHRRWFCNGTTESSNTYALEALASAGAPSQRLLFMTEKNGVISDHQIFLEDKRLPIMKRNIRSTLEEFGPDTIREMMDKIWGDRGSE